MALPPMRPTTVMVNDPVVEFPEASVAVQVTTVVPRGKVEPLFGEQLTAGSGSTASPAMGSRYVTTAPAASADSMVWAGGSSTNAGAVVSRTVMVTVCQSLRFGKPLSVTRIVRL